MTNRDFYEAIKAGKITNEVMAFADEAIAKLDTTNAKRREKAAQKADANAVLVDKLVAYLGSDAQTATDILGKFVADNAERPDGKDFNVQFVTSLARKAVEAGKATSVEVKVPKKGTQKGYILG